MREFKVPWSFNPIGGVETMIPMRTPHVQVGIHTSGRNRHRVGITIADLMVTLYQAEAYRLADLLVDAADNLPTPTENTPTPPKETSNE